MAKQGLTNGKYRQPIREKIFEETGLYQGIGVGKGSGLRKSSGVVI